MIFMAFAVCHVDVQFLFIELVCLLSKMNHSFCSLRFLLLLSMFSVTSVCDSDLSAVSLLFFFKSSNLT